MKLLLNISLLTAAFCAIASAAQIQGYLIDKTCEQRIVAGGQPEAASHTNQCNQMTACERSGYFLYTSDGKVMTLGNAGNAKAIAALKKTGKKDNVKAEVTGDVEGGTVKVTSLKLL
jgi:hypothetical protein